VAQNPCKEVPMDGMFFQCIDCVQMMKTYGDHYLHSDLFVTSLSNLSESDYEMDEIVSIHNFGMLNKISDSKPVFRIMFHKLLDYAKHGMLKISKSVNLAGSNDIKSHDLFLGSDSDLYLSSYKHVYGTHLVELRNGVICNRDTLPSEVVDFVCYLGHYYPIFNFLHYAYEISVCDGDLYVSNVIVDLYN
jgi:hypothetical protein